MNIKKILVGSGTWSVQKAFITSLPSHKFNTVYKNVFPNSNGQRVILSKFQGQRILFFQ